MNIGKSILQLDKISSLRPSTASLLPFALGAAESQANHQIEEELKEASQ